MAIYGYVKCICFKQNNTLAPPCKEYLRNMDNGLNQDIFLEIPDDQYEIHANYFEELKELLYYWIKVVCEHENTGYAETFIEDNSSFLSFRLAIEKSGDEDIFPVLSKYLPYGNDDILPKELAQKALEELKYFEDKIAESIDTNNIFAEHMVKIAVQYYRIMESLRQLLNASIETGNPIIWE
jgi:hypothetical protein